MKTSGEFCRHLHVNLNATRRGTYKFCKFLMKKSQISEIKMLLFIYSAKYLKQVLIIFFKLKYDISFRLKTDHNEDESVTILSTWVEKTKTSYHSVHFASDPDSPALRPTETNQSHWPEERFHDLIRMKEEAFEHARKIWADFIFVSIKILMSKQQKVKSLNRIKLEII